MAEAKCDDEQTLMKNAETLRANLDIKDRTYMFKKYQQCFVGSEAIPIIINLGFAETETQAITFGDQLIKLNILQHVTKDHTFKNGNYFYKFVKSEPQEPNAVFYHQGFGARGTPVRLSFEIAGIKYIDASQEDGLKHLGADIQTGYPTFAYPVAKIDGAVISQTPAICQYVLAKSGFQPSCIIKRAQSLQVALTAADTWAEYYAQYKDDKEPSDEFIKTRIYKFFNTLENQLKQNNNGRWFFFDDKPSIADVFVYDIFNRFRLVRPDLYKECGFDALKGFLNLFESYPAITKYLSSDRYKAVKGKATTGKMGFLSP